MSLDAFKNLIEPIESRMVRTIARLVRDPDDAADTMQEVLSTVWKKLETIRTHENPSAYVMRICISKAYDTLRKRSRETSREISIEDLLNVDWAGPQNHSDEGVSDEQLELVRGVMAAVIALPTQQAQAVLLRIMEEYSFREIAQALGCAEATAYSHFSKGKARLREILTAKSSKKAPVK